MEPNYYVEHVIGHSKSQKFPSSGAILPCLIHLKSWESKGTIKGLLTTIVPQLGLIRALFLGGWHWGGPVRFP